MYAIGTMLVSKKRHACGSNIWQVVRNGADYKLMCQNCQRVILVSSVQVDKYFKGK